MSGFGLRIGDRVRPVGARTYLVGKIGTVFAILSRSCGGGAFVRVRFEGIDGHAAFEPGELELVERPP